MLCSAISCMAQFSKEVAQAYRLYNKARLLEASGHLDSAAILMKRSILLNNKNGTTRDYAEEIYIKAGHYTDFVNDVKDYYTKNTLPENADEIFAGYDAATVAKAKKSKEIREFLASYDALLKKNRATVKVNHELKEILERCNTVDQFVRFYPVPKSGTQCDTQFADRLVCYADSTNMENVAKYIRKKGFPNSSELDGVSMSSNFVISFLHYLQNTEVYSKYPSWKYLDSTLLNAVYLGNFPVRYYLLTLEKRYFGTSYNNNHHESRQLYGIVCPHSFDSVTKKKIKIYDPEIDDMEHVDERRAKWLQPSLYEESLIDPEIRLPVNYHQNQSL